MSGHSKWSTIRRKKGAVDIKRGKIFSKLMKELMVAARMGGGDPAVNPRLRSAIVAARAENMPKQNIENAIKKGTGEGKGIAFEECIYEGYGPSGVAVLTKILTDNKRRTVAEIRHLFSKNNGNLGEAGCVAWMFEQKGLLIFDKNVVTEEELMELALDMGADDVKEEGSEFHVETAPAQFETLRHAVEERGWEMIRAELTMVPKTVVKVEDKSAEQVLRLMEALEDHDDIQQVYANFDIPDELIEEMGG